MEINTWFKIIDLRLFVALHVDGFLFGRGAPEANEPERVGPFLL